MEVTSEVEGLRFKWGRKRETVGLEKKDVEYYESFIFDGSEYCLYDCVLAGDARVPDFSEYNIGKIINMYQYNNDQCQNSRRVELLWFFKPYEVDKFLELEGVRDVLEKELFLASGTGPGLTNDNPVEAICGKCNVLCISKDQRNPQPSDEEIKLADYLFRRTFDVTSNKILEKIDDQIAGIDVKFIFNKASFGRKASVVQKVAPDSLKPNQASSSSSDRQSESNASGFSVHRKSDYDYNKGKDSERHRQLTREKSTVAKERYNKDSGRHDGGFDRFNASDSRRNDFLGKKDQESEAKKQLTKQRSRLAEDRSSEDYDSLDHMPLMKRKLYVSAAVSDRKMKESQNYGREDIRSSRDKGTRGEVYSQKPSITEKNQDRRIPRFCERTETKYATEKALGKKPISEQKLGTGANYRRDYRAFEVTQKPTVEEVTWMRSLSWEESLKDAEGQGKLVLLQNLDPTYTSDEVENIVYSALNEQCTARMIERTSATIPHIGEALVIFKTTDAAKRVVRRLDQGCLLLSNGRTLVASSVEVNPPAMPSLRFPGHIKPRAQMRQDMKSAVATAHSAQKHTIEFDLGMEWCLYRDQYELTWKMVYERQTEEKKKWQIRFRPKRD